MESYYLLLLGLLFLLAISDLIVGVSNDAVNFLNAAVGSRASTFRVIILVASLGVIVGCLFSSGMMEVARKGILNPGQYYFADLMVIFTAVMIADVVLLDTFNTLGLPTSTTVSVVFELLGAAVALAVIKSATGAGSEDIAAYINSGKALAIISGILISVVVAFTAGFIVQYLLRLALSFDYEKKEFASTVWGGISAAGIMYFMLVKGAKGAAFMTEDSIKWLQANWIEVVGWGALAWACLLGLIRWLFKANILRLIVLSGTFALAMAFASNDLVNFIGVPLAGYNAWEIWQQSGADPTALSMEKMAGEVPTPSLMLFLAGVIMALTIWFSKKAQTVVKTSVDLGRQYEGYERFNSFALSRSLVRHVGRAADRLAQIVPDSLRRFNSRQFDPTPFVVSQKKQGREAPAFDLVRASSTLFVAAFLISIGTNMKLPLSTTYVTFMVFMGASLADGAWGRESAVYRVSGVLSVVGGWFVTAMTGFLLAFLLASLIYFGGMPALLILIGLAGYSIYRSHLAHNRKLEVEKDLEQNEDFGPLTRSKILDLINRNLMEMFQQVKDLLPCSIQALEADDLKLAKKTFKDYQLLEEKAFKLKAKATKSLERIGDDQIEAAHLFIIVAEYMDEITHIVRNIVKPSFEHIDNNHKPLIAEQIAELRDIQNHIDRQINLLLDAATRLDPAAMKMLSAEFSAFTKLLRQYRKTHIKRIKNHMVGTRNSILYFNHLGEYRNLAIYINRMAKIFDDLVIRESTLTYDH
ncbi:MAG: phosphate transporter [Saprospiraceae bacterium]|nr:MAG: phosphate transporter [Saprospiraceae bacterium]